MKLPWNQRPPRPQLTEAREARIQAEQELARVRSETRFYAELGDSLKKLREHNHFEMAIKATFQGGRP